MAHFDECLRSIFDQDRGDLEVIWVDSASTDGSPEAIAARFPQTKILALSDNAGYRRATNVGARQAQGKYLVICNQDTRMDRTWLSAMIRCVEADPSIGIVAPKILLADRPQTINEAGNTLHYSGLYGSRGLGAPSTDYDVPEILATMSGCCFLIRKDLWDELGGFSEDFDQFDSGWHASYEDADLAWRAQLLGYTVLYCCSATMYHKYERRGVPPARFCSFDWGWHIVAIRNYRALTLFLLLPMLAGLDLATWLYAMVRGPAWLAAKCRVAGWLLTHVADWRQMRQRVQSMRRIGDLPIVRRMSPVLSQGGSGWMKRIAGSLSAFYFRFLLCALRWIEVDDSNA